MLTYGQGTFNISNTYDPFSRYTPFRVEVNLDKDILEQVVKSPGEPAKKTDEPPAKKSRKDVVTPPANLIVHHPFSTPRFQVDLPSLFASSTSLVSQLLSSRRSAAGAASTTSLAVDLYALAFPDPSRLHAPTADLVSPIQAGLGSGLSRGSGQKQPADELLVHGAIIRSPRVYVHSESLSRQSTRRTVAAREASFQIPIIGGFVVPIQLVDSTEPPEGFTVKGDIDVFGAPGLTAEFSNWNGPVPEGVDIVDEDSKAIYDRAVVRDDLKLSSIMPVLQGTFFDKIVFRHVVITHQNAPFDTTRAVGWHLDVDFPITTNCGTVHDVLRTVIGVDEPVVHLHAGLGKNQSWEKSVRIHSFTLDGSFPGVQKKVCEGLTLTSVGVELLGIRRMERFPRPRAVMDYGFGVFGTLNIDVSGSVVPLELDYRIREIGKVLQLSADIRGDIWDSPLGISGLQVRYRAHGPFLNFQADECVLLL